MSMLMIFEVMRSLVFIFFILWVIFYLVGFKIKKKISNDEKMIYECGFKNFNNLSVNANVNFLGSICLVLFYEMEILFILPIGMNMGVMSLQSMAILLLFLAVMSGTLIIDRYFNLVKWLY